ncbi:MAG: 2-C-methyl-D-erythritol 4-phosphate cytidylyltransferase [Xanthomonadales bacterium]
MGAPSRLHALIPAAGRSRRFGGEQPKQYALLLGRPVLAHSIDALRRHPGVGGVTVVLAADDRTFEECLRPEFPDVQTTPGGDSRARSVLNGLESIARTDPACEWVLVHDAARPCLGHEELARLVERGMSARDGAILAVPVRDTLKQADAHARIERTVDRSVLWAAQTPQMFRPADLADRLAAALAAGEEPTDEAGAMERAGRHPLLVEGCPTNIKITGPGDLALAEFILRRRGAEDAP